MASLHTARVHYGTFDKLAAHFYQFPDEIRCLL